MNIIWTAFCFEPYTPEQLHCTHKFFDEQSVATTVEIAEIIDRHLKGGFKPFKIFFDREEMFGPKKDVRVLTPSYCNLGQFYPELRAELNRFRKDDWPYSPHITSHDIHSINLPFHSYVLMRNDEVVKEW